MIGKKETSASLRRVLSRSPRLDLWLKLTGSLPEIRDKMAVARAHQGDNGCEFV